MKTAKYILPLDGGGLGGGGPRMIPLTPPSPARGEGVIGLFSDQSVL